ncbi:hypothetical protein F4814DRAFT_406264 [Daldinia grandis]|nr:hypothetical protein F4814DRAFT_406264 [Daldinia grandis]
MNASRNIPCVVLLPLIVSGTMYMHMSNPVRVYFSRLYLGGIFSISLSHITILYHQLEISLSYSRLRLRLRLVSIQIISKGSGVQRADRPIRCSAEAVSTH